MRVVADRLGDDEEVWRRLFHCVTPIRSVVSCHVRFLLGGIDSLSGSRDSEVPDL